MSEETQIPNKVDDIFKKSGNNLHVRVVNTLRKDGWEVKISPYYKDNTTEKSREIDIIAEKAFTPEWVTGFPCKENIRIRLFIECKYITEETVFWFDNKNKIKAKKIITENTPCDDNNLETDKHHYLSGHEAVKLYSSGITKSTNNESIYLAINQSLHSLIYFRDSPTISENSRGDERPIINYPVIICNNFDYFYQTNFKLEPPKKIVEETFQIELNYAYKDTKSEKDIDEFFLIDIINYEKLTDFTKMLSDECQMMSVFLRH